MNNHWKSAWYGHEDDEETMGRGRGRGRHRRDRARRKFRHFMNQGPGGWRRPKHNIPVNIVEHESGYELTVHALTYPKDKIKVSVVDDMLYVTGSREPEDSSPNFVLQEYPIKSFERSFELSHKVDKDKIEAKFVEGVLIVSVPKTSEAQQPEITIDIL